MRSESLTLGSHVADPFVLRQCDPAISASNSDPFGVGRQLGAFLAEHLRERVHHRACGAQRLNDAFAEVTVG
nr:hypothetical protein [Planosporangium thailandense]